MGPGGAPDVIWISSDDDDDDDDDEDRGAGQGDSVLLVEPAGDAAEDVGVVAAGAGSDEDSDVLVTFCRGAQVLPHARHDCPAHAFR